jgi:hypothetical protein
MTKSKTSQIHTEHAIGELLSFPEQKLRFAVILVLTIFVLLGPQIAKAVSGTCSSHGGVDCNAGPDWDFSAVCNDGWSDSSENYYSTVGCSNNSACTSDELLSLQQKYGVYDLINQINALKSQINDRLLQLQKDIDGEEQRPIPLELIIGRQNELRRIASIDISNLELQITSAQQRLSSNGPQIISECKSLGFKRYTDIQNKINQSRIESLQRTSIICGPNATPVGTSCQCNKGFVTNASNSECVSGQGRCQAQFGNHSTFNEATNTCYCDVGYEFIGSYCVESKKSVAPVELEKKASPPQTKPQIVPNIYLSKPTTTSAMPSKESISSTPPTNSLDSGSIEKPTIASNETQPKTKQKGIFRSFLDFIFGLFK